MSNKGEKEVELSDETADDLTSLVDSKETANAEETTETEKATETDGESLEDVTETNK